MDSAMVLSPATSDCSKEDIRESRVEVINLEEEEADETEEEAEEESMDELDHDNTTVSQKDRPHVKRRRTKPPPRSLPARSARTRDATTPPWLKDTRRSTRQKAADLRKTGKSKYAESTPLPPAPKVVKGPTARAKVRIQIAANNKPKRDAFLLNHRELFEPLLPANNYISKLPSSSPKALAKHVAIDQQPEG
jgi:SWI/SNF-related matrix-associated actin-dependent regulator of chromatin subfamily A member 5